ncbi:MAG: hypothetical protein ACLTMP_03095 [Eggerthella lenta]
MKSPAPTVWTCSRTSDRQELTAEGQSLVKDGIYGVAHVTEGIAKGSAYMERF